MMYLISWEFLEGMSALFGFSVDLSGNAAVPLVRNRRVSSPICHSGTGWLRSFLQKLIFFVARFAGAGKILRIR